jgi:predicted  nucleic acid-binding Zn-ribbon protein
MPHQCVRCNTFYEDGAKEILSGCNCGGKLFFFVSKAKLAKAKEMQQNLSKKEKDRIEKDVLEMVGEREDKDAPVILDLETIRVKKPGKFELDLVHLFDKEKPLIYKLGSGKYVIDIAESFKKKE